MFLLRSLTAALAAAPALAAPATKDVPYTTSKTDLEASLTCPKGIKGAAGGTVLLVHGTGSIGAESWVNGPYLDILPKLSPGYDVCYVTLPNRSLGDITKSAEYVAYNIQKLGQSKPISVVTHSQGGVNMQWALRWWPSTRKLVKVFVALSADFHGALLFSPLTNIPFSQSASSYQQASGGRFANLTYTDPTYNSALVPTTSIWTLEEEVVQFGPGVNTIHNPDPKQ